MRAPSRKKRTNPSICRVPFFSVGGPCFFPRPVRVVYYGTPQPGEIRAVTHLKARLMRKPGFVGASILTIRRGGRIKVISVAGSWCFVEYRGRKGWVHKNRIMKKKIRISSGNTGTGTSRGEMEIGGRG
ncbi:MAG: hypothetical protein ABFS16_00265 [Bacteroidota bacterium]